jgi:mRNA-degrading endonuclease RelE of RelBE toxin-antitoxin system
VTQVGIAKKFKADLGNLPGPIARKAAVWLTEFMLDPEDARFEAHRVTRSLMPNLWTAKLDDSYRVIYRLDQDGIRHLLLCDVHDRAYRRAEKLKAVNLDGVVKVVEAAPEEALPAAGEHGTPAGPARAVGRSFMAWTDAELEAAGVPAHAVPGVRALDSDDELLDFCAEAGPLGELLLTLHEDGPPALAARLDPVLPEGRDPAAPGKVEAALRTEAAGSSLVVVDSADELERVLAQPIEDWMIYLHPTQAAAVRRPVGGPARVRGPAGTGKTVVALHRAAFVARELARRGDDEPVLVTTFIRSLPVVLGNLFERLAPDVVDRVEFDNLHGWASALLKARRLPYNVNPTLTDRLFAEALECPAGARLQAAGLGPGYLSEEVQYFVKGRDLRRVEDYLALSRTSRGTPLRADQRRDLWEVADRYRAACGREQVRDFGDLVVEALRALEARPLDRPYAAVVVDEAQDLTEAGLKLLLAALRPGGELLLAGDGQQSIYPGSYSLRSVGLDVRGRSTILTASYRSCRCLLEAALAVMAGHPFDDLEDEAHDGRRSVTWVRDGEPPLLRGFADPDDERRFVVADIAARADAGEVGLGDVAVFCTRTADVKAMLTMLKQRRIPAQDLTAYKGRTTRAVKVGTYHRAKGLEFKEVYLPHVNAGLLPPALSATADTGEAEELARRRFFVGMTRARDRLVITWSGERSGFLVPLGTNRSSPVGSPGTGSEGGGIGV